MSKFFDYGDEEINAEGWYRITATNVNMNTPMLNRSIGRLLC